MDRTDKITLGTLISTSVIGLGGGAYAGFCDAHSIDPALGLLISTRNCALWAPTYIGAFKGCMIGFMMNDKCGGGHGEILDSIESLVSGFCVGTAYGIVGAVATGVGYGLGYLAGHLTK